MTRILFANISLKRTKQSLPIAIAFLALTAPAGARDFATPGNEAIRHHLSLLSDSNNTSIQTTTWPIDSAKIDRALGSIDRATLSEAERYSFDLLSDWIMPNGRDTRSALSLHAGSGREDLRGFASDHREKTQARLSLNHSTDIGVFGNLDLGLYGDQNDAFDTRLDASYLALDWKGWTFGGGKIDRWWGPGWQSSLILSNNARPSPGVFVSRSVSTAFEMPLLKLLGPWSVDAFANQLEKDRFVPNAKLLGFRFVFNPMRNLEIGLSRSAQWGGDGRPQSLQSLWNLAIGRDNRGDSGIAADGSNEPGNQLGGIDWRWTKRIADLPITMYGQLIGEDEAGGLPSREIGMFGIEIPWTTLNVHGRLFVEASDTTMRFWDDPLANSAYNHSIYQSGYRHYGESIGASSDNDSRTFAAGGYHEVDKIGAITWKAVYGSLNRDGVEARNLVAPEAMRTVQISLEYAKSLNPNTSISLGGYHERDSISPQAGYANSGLMARIELLR